MAMCRTGQLGGHVEACLDCGHVRIRQKNNLLAEVINMRLRNSISIPKTDFGWFSNRLYPERTVLYIKIAQLPFVRNLDVTKKNT